MVARQIGGEVIAYKEGERSEVFSGFSADGKIGCNKKDDSNYVATVLCLFSGEMQYGILVTEIDPANLSLFLSDSRQTEISFVCIRCPENRKRCSRSWRPLSERLRRRMKF